MVVGSCRPWSRASSTPVTCGLPCEESSTVSLLQQDTLPAAILYLLLSLEVHLSKDTSCPLTATPQRYPRQLAVALRFGGSEIRGPRSNLRPPSSVRACRFPPGRDR